MTTKEYYAKNKEKIKAYNDSYYKNYGYKKVEYSNEYYKQNTEKVLEGRRKYTRSLRGVISLRYIGMRNRVCDENYPRYYGLPLLDREIYLEWARSSEELKTIFNNWVASGYSRKLSPSIDRIDSSKGYTLDNIRWLSISDNSRLGVTNRHEKARKEAQSDNAIIEALLESGNTKHQKG